MSQPYFLYILYSEKIDKYYVGVSHDPEQRLISHNEYSKGWTKRGIPWKLVFVKEFPGKKEAMEFESWLKRQKKRVLVEAIIEGTFDWNE